MPQQYLETTHHSVNWFAQADEADQLDIAPSFQRRPVWSQRQKSDLIGTMLLGYPIPELYINEVVSGDGDETYSLIDGQQRIRAALEFLNGDFALDASDGVPVSAHGSRFDDLGEAERRAIRNYKLVVRTLRDVDETVIREMFRRLNQGVVALNDQELRHATYEGPFLVLMEKLADDPQWSEFGVFSADDIRRMRDVEFVSEIAIMLLNGPQNKKLTLDRWYQTYEDSFEEATELHALFERVLYEVQAILPDLKRTRWKKRSDFYSLTGALGRHQAALPCPPSNGLSFGWSFLLSGKKLTERSAPPMRQLCSSLTKTRIRGLWKFRCQTTLRRLRRLLQSDTPTRWSEPRPTSRVVECGKRSCTT